MVLQRRLEFWAAPLALHEILGTEESKEQNAANSSDIASATAVGVAEGAGGFAVGVDVATGFAAGVIAVSCGAVGVGVATCFATDVAAGVCCAVVVAVSDPAGAEEHAATNNSMRVGMYI